MVFMSVLSWGLKLRSDSEGLLGTDFLSFVFY